MSSIVHLHQMRFFMSLNTKFIPLAKPYNHIIIKSKISHLLFPHLEIKIHLLVLEICYLICSNIKFQVKSESSANSARKGRFGLCSCSCCSSCFGISFSFLGSEDISFSGLGTSDSFSGCASQETTSVL